MADVVDIRGGRLLTPNCVHLQLEWAVTVVRIVPEGAPVTSTPIGYMLHAKIRCQICGQQLRFTGVPAASSLDFPTCDPTETELHAPLRDASLDPDGGKGIPGYAVALAEAIGAQHQLEAELEE